MTGFVVSAGGFDFFSCGLGINGGRYWTVSGHYGAFTYGVMAEYKHKTEFHLRPYVRMYGGSAGMLLGLSAIYANDTNNQTIGMGPEVGLGFMNINILYRYNFYLDKDFNCHEFALVVYRW